MVVSCLEGISWVFWCPAVEMVSISISAMLSTHFDWSGYIFGYPG
jgi:hypothetical protein